jgi:uncharacterized membrane protein YgcG
MVPALIGTLLYYFWRVLRRQQAAEAARQFRIRQLREQNAQLATQWSKVLAPPAPRVSQPTVGTPRKAATAPKPRPVQRTITPFQPAQPATQASEDISNLVLAASVGSLIGSILNNDRPSQSCSVSSDNEPFRSGGGGDFGGGGASSDWSSSDSSSSSDNNN